MSREKDIPGTGTPRARRSGKHRLALTSLCSVVLASLIGIGGLVAPSSADAAAPGHAVLPAPLVLAASATPSALSYHGGTVPVSGRVQNAATCQLQLLSRQGFAVDYASNIRPCTSTFSARVTIGANPSTVPRTVAFELVARNGARNSSGRFFITLAPKVLPPPRVAATIGVNPPALPPSGGNVTLSWAAANATICRLTVSGPVPSSSYGISGSSLAGLISDSPDYVVCTGAITFPVGAGLSRMQQWAFTLSAGTISAGSGKATTTLRQIAVPPPPAPPPTTRATTAPGFLPQQQTSSNWAGYGVSGGSYTSVEGTFTVTALATGSPSSGVMSEWVGIDGLSGSSGVQDLIQAGVQESMLPCTGSTTYSNGSYSPNRFYICPWTFFIKDGQDSQGPDPDISVAQGDSVTVEIWQQTGTNWAISMVDNTNGRRWSIGNQYYAGPGSSAEWIVEDPGIVGQACGTLVDSYNGQCPMPGYMTPVAFSNMLLAPSTVTAWYEISLVQSSVQVATPSALNTSGSVAAGFSVSYTGIEAPGRLAASSVIGRRTVDYLATPVLARRVERGVGSARGKRTAKRASA